MQRDAAVRVGTIGEAFTSAHEALFFTIAYSTTGLRTSGFSFMKFDLLNPSNE